MVAFFQIVSGTINLMKRQRQLAVSLFLPLLLILSVPTAVYAQTTSSWIGTSCVGPDTVADAASVATIRGVICLFQNLLVVVLTLIGLLTFVMIVAGGFRMLAAGGEPKAVEAAKQTISTAITGLVIAVASWFVIQIIAKVTGIDSLTQFEIPTFL